MRKFIVAALMSGIFISGQAQKWTIYTSTNSGLPSNHVSAILCDRENTLWMATNSGLARKKSDVWSTYTTDFQLPANSINSIFLEDNPVDINLWISTNSGAARLSFTGDSLQSVKKYTRSGSGLASDSVWLMAVDKLDNKWFATLAGVSGFNNTAWFLNTVSNNESLLTNVSCISSFPDGWNLFGTKGTGVARMKMDLDGVTGASSYVQNYTGLWSDNILCVFIDSLGNQWFGTDRGMSYHEGFETLSGWDAPTFRRSTHPISDTVFAVKMDAEGRLWMATPTGLVVYTDPVFKTFDMEDGLPENSINDFAFDKDGNIWVATDSGIAAASLKGLLLSGGPYIISGSPGGIEKIYPSVANYLVQIKFNNPSRYQDLELMVCDMNGRVVRNLINGSCGEGSYTVSWNCTDNSGSKVSHGMYLVILKMGNRVDTRRVIVN